MSAPEHSPEHAAQLLNDTQRGWTKAMDLQFLTASDEEISVAWTVAEQHLQPFGLVHGGVHAGVIETLCSIGAALSAYKRGHKGTVVGLENHTSFIRGVGIGTKLRASAVPVTRGRTTQVWDAKVTDEQGQVVAQGSVRLLVVAEGVIPAPSTPSTP